ncbi:MAG: PLP-dependent aminotransferase family protein [Candidatus Cloacimonetes bacterium]|nr:PLP-dependent aminotransferase family protein [Candidatus Cloacimonadota bacterium]MCF7814223.1 PLP-dependent aminotransferase family protein [Candidatus Cloacimonadota bacterium]MCF7868118.1 PLP-dependent aminotransferase family protein [Candidatus Cloacimonadota bacterium]MCF7883584.1 PLP-dependent aminotransferase family protein [Candidatus Cloacimonadota bacterium]
MITNWQKRYSDNIKEFEGYSIGKIFKYLNNPEIISLAGGLPSPEMFQVHEMRLASKKRLEEDITTIMQYTAVPGEISLKKAIIDFLSRDNINISEENLVVTSSGQHGLDLTGRLFINPGDIIMLDRPTFAGAIVAFQMQRPKIIGIDLESDGVDVDSYEKELKKLKKEGKKPKFIYVVPDFQNPSGITTSLTKRKKLLELSYEFDVPIVEDSPYRDLRYRGETIPSIFSLDQQNGGQNVIGLYTFSKLFCPGIRVGFNIGPSDVIGRMTNIKEANILNTPKYNQDMCTEFLTTMGFDEHIAKCRKYYREKLDVFLQTMEEHFPPEMGVTWTKPEGGLFLWVTVPQHIDTNELFMEAIKFKVAFVPGDVFYGENPSTNHMRINFSFASKKQLAEAVKRLSKCIKAQL